MKSLFDDFMPAHDSVLQIYSKIVKLIIPLILTSFFAILSEQINFYFVGNLDNTSALAAVGLSHMVINICAFSFIFGMNSALETLVS
jgi:Na+-driven multidrug efflux pump